MGKASRAKRKSVTTPAERTALDWSSLDHQGYPGEWFKIGVCKACGRTGQITTAENMCAPAPPGFKDCRAESCLAIVERRKARTKR